MAIISSVGIRGLLDFRFDADCYQPELLETEDRIAALNPRLLGAVASVSDGNHVSIAEHFCSDGVRYLKGAELSDFFIDDTDPTYIPQKIYESLARSHVRPDDVLLSVIGTVGPVAFMTNRFESLSCSCKLAILRPHSISGPCLAVYLCSKWGQQLLRRRARGTVQQGVILPDLRQFPIPNFPEHIIHEVEQLVSEAATAALRGAQLYPEAEAELVDRLGWKGLLDHSRELSYSSRLSAMSASGRSDAEFYHPSLHRLRQHIMSRGAARLAQFCPMPTRGVQPEYDPSGSVLALA